MGDNMVQAGSSCRDDRWSLLGMTALVTGGTQGIGSLSLSLSLSLSQVSCFMNVRF